MAQGSTYRVKFRRRREGKTNYYRRRRMLKSKLPRLVVRKTNTKIIAQVMTAKVIGDITEASAISPELEKYGWEAGKHNLPAAYLTGLLVGLRAKSRGIEKVILDIGLNTPVNGSRVYAALNGALNAGLDIPHGAEVLPDEDRLKGKHIVESFKHFDSEDNEGNMFAEIGAKKRTITSIPKTFEEVKQALLDIPKSELKKRKKSKKPKKKPKKEKDKKKKKPEERPPRAKPTKPKPKRLTSRGKGKKGKKGKR